MLLHMLVLSLAIQSILMSATVLSSRMSVKIKDGDDEYSFKGTLSCIRQLVHYRKLLMQLAAQSDPDYKQTSAMPNLSLQDGILEADSFIGSIDPTDTEVVGATTLLKRKYAFDQFAKIFDKYDLSMNEQSTSKIIFRNTIIPGFEKTFSTLHAFNIKTNNTKISPNEYVRGADSYLAIRNIGHQVEFPKSSASDTAYDVIVRTGESTYTLNGVSYNRGDTATVGDITYNFGSVQASISDVKKLNFILTAFDTNMTLTQAGELGEITHSITRDATATLSTTVSKEVLRNTFFYRTDDAILADSSFVAFFVDDTAWSDLSLDMNPRYATIGSVSDGAYKAGDTLAKDFIRDLARQLFGTHLGADLFTNEDAVADNFNTKCDEIADAILQRTRNVNITNASSTLELDTSLNYYFLKDDPSNTNICREIVTQMISQDTERFQNVSDISYSSQFPGYWKVPFQAGDVLSYKITSTASANQHTAINTGRTSMDTRTYQINLNVGN